ncbi:succinate dehydrogenase cytochrome b subunit [Hymenobacter volaticus]|uniref:Succinate dehydrogenase cytochrome b subunit n=1 Tax=Hymenobacter volaticus TaxID=2932254 RepID=A0ABY4GET8_9BACT|nr:succinate dehydrogenase cytochrome b subunit [Hymenobacter volaticus]UOQ69441.1 succinate dehydrogenase cytochrome b subunit [Hymenobacter volaticus]
MNWLTKTLSSSIGRKITMSLTGLFLCSFLLVHLSINLMMLLPDGGDTFNIWAEFMATNPIIRTLEVVLLLGLLLHAYQGLRLAITNRKARGPVAYVVNHTAQNSRWASRNMTLLGILLLLYLGVHMGNFWLRSRFGLLGGLVEVQIPTIDHPVKDLYSLGAASFKIPWYVTLYVLAQVALGYHLWHGFRSSWQSLGLNHRKYNPMVYGTGYVFSVVVPLLFALIPLAILFSSAYQPREATRNIINHSLQDKTPIQQP